MREAIKIDGEVLKIPTGIHIDGMLYYNMEVAEEAGVDPTTWTSVDEMFADMEKVEGRRLQPSWRWAATPSRPAT